MVTEDDAAPTAPQAAYDMALWQLGEQAQANRSFRSTRRRAWR